MLSVAERHVIARESNVVRVDFSREPDPPAPCFPGANGLRLSDTNRDGEEALRAIAIRAPEPNERMPIRKCGVIGKSYTAS
jgi:hypothetical protein